MSSRLRGEILVILDGHSKTGSAQLKKDKDIAAATQQPVLEIQRQLDILESHGYVSLAKTMGPTYEAMIEPGGMLAVERLRENGTLDA